MALLLPRRRAVILRRRGLAPALRFIATRGVQAYTSNGGATRTMSRTHHYARDNITGLRLVYPAWHGDETALGGTAAITASIEYPAGTFNQVLFSASPTGTIPNGGMLVSDMKTVAIPVGAKFWVRTFYVSAAGILFTDGGDTSNGDLLHYGGGEVTDMTMGGTIPSDHPSLMYFPIALLGMTKKSGVLVIGDSIGHGQSDLVDDGTGDQGIIARSIGPAFGYSKVAKPGETFTTFLGNSTNRVALGAYASHVVGNLSINDFIQDRSAAQAEADLVTLRALYAAGVKVFWLTSTPYATSSDNWVTTANQSIFDGQAARNAQRLIFNNRLRSGFPAGVAGCFDVADVLESARDSGKWGVNGVSQYLTGDGLHPSYAAYRLVMNTPTAIATSRIVLP